MRLVSCIPTRDIALTFLGASLGLILSVCADDEASVMYSLRNAYPDWQPRGIVDVGANRGGWTTRVQEEIYPGIKTFMVEASPFHTGALEETKKKFEKFVDFEIAVYPTAKKSTFLTIPHLIVLVVPEQYIPREICSLQRSQT